MKRLFLRDRLALAAVLGLAAGALASCNAIFGISPGIATGGSSSTGSSTITGGTGGAKAVAASSTGTSATGASSTSTGATGGSTTASTTGTGGAAPLKCDGTDPGGADGSTARFSVSAFNALGMGAGLRVDGSIVLGGTFSGTSTVFGSAPLPFTDAGNANTSQGFVTRYANGADVEAQAFVGPGEVGVYTEGFSFNTAFLMAVDKQGRTAIAGNFRGTFTIGGVTMTSQVEPTDSGSTDSLDGFVALFDASWNPVWPPKQLGSVVNDSANGVAIDSQGNVLVLLVSRGNAVASTVDQGCGATALAATPNGNPVFVTKIGLTGACAWHDAFTVDNAYLDDNNNGAGLALAVDLHDDVILAGGAIPASSIIGQGTLGTDAFDFHAFAAKLSGVDGSVTWRRAYEDGNNQVLFAVATDPCGNIVVGGGYMGGAKFGTLPALVDPPNANDLDQQGVLVELDPSGEPKWQDAFNGRGWTGVSAISVNHASDIALVGILQDGPSSVGIDFLGKLLVPPAPLNVSETDFYVAKLKGDGSLRWVDRYGGDYYDSAFAVALDDAGHLVATGGFSTTLDFGSGMTLTAAEEGDFYAVEFGP